MISPSIPPSRPTGAEERGKGGRERKGFIVVHLFIHYVRLISSSFLVSDFRISIGYISPRVFFLHVFGVEFYVHGRYQIGLFFSFIP